MSVQRAQAEITSSEFLDWVVFLNEEERKLRKEDFYFANIAAEVRRSWVKDPRKVRGDMFLIKTEERKPSTKTTAAEKAKSAKAFFGRMLGFSKEKEK